MRKIGKGIFILSAVTMNFLAASCSREVRIFNGENLDGWVCVLEEEVPAGAEPTFSVRDGMIHITGTPQGYLRTDRIFEDYTLTLEWRWNDGRLDSGIFNRLQPGDRVWPTGIQFQMRTHDFGWLVSGVPLEGYTPDEKGMHRKPSLYDGDPQRPDGEWNEMKFVLKGTHYTVWMNGILINESECDATSGYIALQSETCPMDVRNIRLVLNR